MSNRGDSIKEMLPLFQVEDGGAIPTSPLHFVKSNYKVIKIDLSLAQRISIANHYLHRRASCSLACGLLFRGDIVGIVLYGTPSNRNLRTGICGKDESLNVIELTRLWVADHVPRNAESFLISHSLKFLNKEIVVSYADPSFGHLGTVYQSAGFIYTGLSAKRPEYKVVGLETSHKQSIFDDLKTRRYAGDGLFGQIKRGSQVSALRRKYGNKLEMGQQIRKHRYVRFLGPRKNQLIKKLKYPILVAPKWGDN